MLSEQKTQFLKKRYLQKKYRILLREVSLFYSDYHEVTFEIENIRVNVKHGWDMYIYLDVLSIKTNGQNIEQKKLWIERHQKNNKYLISKIHQTCYEEIQNFCKQYLNHPLLKINVYYHVSNDVLK